MPGRQVRHPGGSKNKEGEPTPDAAGALAQEVEQAHSYCLRLLSYRLRSEQELRQALARRGISDQATAHCLERLRELGLVNDREFAGSWVRSRMQGSPLGTRALLARLARFGVDREVAGEAVAAWGAESAQVEAAAGLARKRAGGKCLDAALRARLMRYLMGRGFPYPIAREAVGSLEPERK